MCSTGIVLPITRPRAVCPRSLGALCLPSRTLIPRNPAKAPGLQRAKISRSIMVDEFHAKDEGGASCGEAKVPLTGNRRKTRDAEYPSNEESDDTTRGNSRTRPPVIPLRPCPSPTASQKLDSDTPCLTIGPSFSPRSTPAPACRESFRFRISSAKSKLPTAGCARPAAVSCQWHTHC